MIGSQDILGLDFVLLAINAADQSDHSIYLHKSWTTCPFEMIFGMVAQNYKGNAMNMVIYVKGTRVAWACPELPDFAQIVYHKNN